MFSLFVVFVLLIVLAFFIAESLFHFFAFFWFLKMGYLKVMSIPRRWVRKIKKTKKKIEKDELKAYTL